MVPHAQYYFFGTPHMGLEVDGLLKVVKDGSHEDNSRLSFIKQLDERANFIDTQREDIINLLGPESGIQIFSFYQTKISQDQVKVRIPSDPKFLRMNSLHAGNRAKSVQLSN
jgi:hypothetical protein